MARFDIRETPSLDRRPEPEGRRPERVPERPGHRRHYDPLQEKHTIAERKDAAVADVSHYRVVAVADIVRERFGGNPYAARKALDQMKAAGWVTERTLEGPEGGKYRVLSPTTAGAREARTQGLSWGMDPQQRAWDGAGRSRAIWDTMWPSTAPREPNRPALKSAAERCGASALTRN